jgi:hypothetical protein
MRMRWAAVVLAAAGVVVAAGTEVPEVRVKAGRPVQLAVMGDWGINPQVCVRT